MTTLKLNGSACKIRYGSALALPRFESSLWNWRDFVDPAVPWQGVSITYNDALSELTPGNTSPSEWAVWSDVSDAGSYSENYGDPSARMYNERVIARFITPLFLDAAESKIVKVFAYAGGVASSSTRNSVQRVDFYANDGSVCSVTDTITDEWGSEVFACRLPDDYSGKVAEIRAVVIPTIGKPRMLQGPTFLVANDLGNLGYADSFTERGVYACQWDEVWYIDPVNGNDSNSGTSQEAPKQTLGSILNTEIPRRFIDLKIVNLNDSANGSILLDQATLLPNSRSSGQLINPRGGVLPGKITGGSLLVSTDGARLEGHDAVIFSNLSIKQDLTKTKTLAVKNFNGRPYWQLENCKFGFRTVEDMTTAYQNTVWTESITHPAQVWGFVPGNTSGTGTWRSLFDCDFQFAGGLSVTEIVNCRQYRPYGDALNAFLVSNGLAVDMNETIYPYGESAPGAGDGLWPEGTFDSDHRDVLQIENQTQSNVVVYGLRESETENGLNSGQGIYASSNPELYDVVFLDCHLKNRSTSSSQYAVQIGHPNSSGWSSDLGPNQSHNVHLEKVSGVGSLRLNYGSPGWTLANSFLWVDRKIDVNNGEILTDPFGPDLTASGSPVLSYSDLQISVIDEDTAGVTVNDWSSIL
jgi:hypothetical protein